MTPDEVTTEALANPGPPWDHGSRPWRTVHRIEGRLLVSVGLVVTVAWLGAGAGYFWPAWVWFGLVLPMALVEAVRWGVGARPGRRLLSGHRALSLVLGLAQILIWVLSGGGYFWPVWPLLGLALLLAVHAIILVPAASGRERSLEARVDVLTRSRRGALDVQAAELRRIERDLHDGAQARLVSAGMTLGLAEELLTADPAAAADLIAEARSSTLAALDDLRTVMRGIHPPVLSDRGLEGAIEALALDVAVPVAVSGGLPGRPPAPVESAAYFAVAEGLANVVKHSNASNAWVTLDHVGGRLSIVVGDDGVGGADLGGGTGLVGIRRRLEPFDGSMAISSPPGGPTVVVMDLPCALS